MTFDCTATVGSTSHLLPGDIILTGVPGVVEAVHPGQGNVAGHYQTLVITKYQELLSKKAGHTASLFAWAKSGTLPITETGKCRRLDTTDFNPFRKVGTPMKGSLVNFSNPQITIRVSEGLRNQEVASTLMARKALVERGKVLALRRKRQTSVLHLFANLLGER